MRLLYVITDMEVGGAQRLLADLLHQYVNHPEMQITFVSYAPSPESSPLLHSLSYIPHFHFDSINIPLSSRAACNPLIRMKAIRWLRPYLRNADVCHVHLFPAVYDVALASRGTDCKLVFTEHSTFNRRRKLRWLRPWERFIYRKYNAIAAVSQAALQSLDEWLDAEDITARLHVIKNGIDIDAFTPPFDDSCDLTPAAIDTCDDSSDMLPENLSQLVEQYDEGLRGITDRRLKTFNRDGEANLFGRDGIAIMMVSRFAESKNHEALIRAFALIKRDVRYEGIRFRDKLFLVLVGDGRKMSEYKSLAKSLDIYDDVVFLGARFDIERLVVGASIGLQLSHWEGAGLTAVEMMAAGVPLIVSDIPGLRNTVRDAALLTDNTPVDIASKIASIADPGTPEDFNDILLRIDRGRTIARRHDIRHTADDYLKLYRP